MCFSLAILYNCPAGWRVGAARMDWSLGLCMHGALWLLVIDGALAPQPFWQAAQAPEALAPASARAARRLTAEMRAVRGGYAGELEGAWKRFETAVARGHSDATPERPRPLGPGKVVWQPPPPPTLAPHAPPQPKAMVTALQHAYFVLSRP